MNATELREILKTAEVDRVPLMVDHIHAPGEPDDRQRRTHPGREEEWGEEPRQQQPEEVQECEQTDRVEHVECASRKAMDCMQGPCPSYMRSNVYYVN